MPGVVKVQTHMLIKSRHGTTGFPPITWEANVDEWVGPFTVEIPTGTTEEALISFGTQGLTTVSVVYITTNVAVSVTYGVAANNVAVDLAPGAPHLIAGCALTAVAISNSSGSTAVCTYFLAGT